MSLKKELTIKAVSEIFKLASRIGIKPRDIIGQGADVIKMGKSLFNTKVNPKLIKFIEKNKKIPTKNFEDIKLHARILKNVTENQKNLFLENIKSIQKAKSLKIPKSQSPVTGVRQPATSVKEQAAEAFKGWTPRVIKGGKEPLVTGGRVGYARKGKVSLKTRLNYLS